MQPYKIPVISLPPTFRKDGSATLKFETQELTDDEKSKALSYMNQLGWLLFAPNEFQDSELPEMKAQGDGGKSPSKRLYSVLFVLWKQLGEDGDFEMFYKYQMEKIINDIKSKLI